MASGSSGTNATPCSRSRAMLQEEASSPSNHRVPAESGRRPRIRSPSSFCPFPETPATPTISPARMVRSSPRSGVSLPEARDQAPRSSKMGPAPGGREGAASAATLGPGSRSPNMSFTRVAASAWSGLGRPATRPWRSTVMRSAQASASRSLWVMKRMA